MATPTITPMQTPFPDKGQSQAAFDYNVDGLMNLFDSMTTELPIALDWIEDRVNEVAATAIGGDLPDITGQATNMIRLNAAGNAAEFRTPAQVVQDLGSGTAGRAVFAAETPEAGQQALGLERLDEDDMASNRDDAVASQQSIKAYVNSKAQMMHIRDEKNIGTDGGDATSDIFLRRDLNTVKENTIPGASLSASQFTLPAGTYDIQASAPAFEAGGHQARLYNATDGTYPIIGSNEVNGFDRVGSSRSLIMGRITITATKSFEIQHRTSFSQVTNGFGVSLGFGPEVYTDVIIRRVV
ncbi:MAG: hypothetical protein V7786_02035 [Sulfitobacter litoralis]|uniref:hypothetical protein n=1 Tax=Sulfitobacter litoralis TaxID=335975 RepID=UPI003003322C